MKSRGEKGSKEETDADAEQRLAENCKRLNRRETAMSIMFIASTGGLSSKDEAT